MNKELMADLRWRAQMSEIVQELTQEVLALTRVVRGLHERIVALETPIEDAPK